MTDAHCHITRGETRHLLCSPFGSEPQAGDAVFLGWHPWYLDGFDATDLRAGLAANPKAGVGEIGLDRLKERTISPAMRAAFEEQLRIAAEFRRPTVLHGVKCWGEVVKTVDRLFRRGTCPIPAFLFHGFSRSDGLLPDIAALNGFVSVGPVILNDHAVNYRDLAKKIPADRLLVESDRTAENADEVPSVVEIAAKLAELRGVSADDLAAQLERNVSSFLQL